MRIQKKSLRGWIPGLLLVMLAGNLYSAEKLGDSVWIHVTYYDFHVKNKCPEFEQLHITGKKTGMVEDTLDRRDTSNRVPVLRTSPVNNPTTDYGPYMNYYIKYWFRDWNSPLGGKGDLTVPKYDQTNGNTLGNYLGIVTAKNDSAFENRVIKDSLLFRKIPNSNGMYQFSDSSFFPIDGRGFGNEGNNHNFAFTMALHYTFTKTQSEQKFTFKGDDDVWAFVDNKLVMDIGGIHVAVDGNFTVDKNLPLNEPVTFDFFFAERHTTESNLMITTNLFVHDIDTLKLNVDKLSACAGDVSKISATIIRDDSLRTDLAKEVVWKIISGDNPASTIEGNNGKSKDGLPKGDTLFFTPTEAYDTTIIEATTYDSIAKLYIKDTVDIVVNACHAEHLSIEDVSFDNDGNPVVQNLRDDEPRDRVMIPMNSNQTDAYAVARDKNGNFVRLADPVTTVWSSEDEDIMTVSGETGKKYRGIINRVADNDSSNAIATEPGLRPDEVLVILMNSCVEKLRLKDADGEIVTSISMHTGEKRAYTVEGKKSNTGAWDVIDAKWELPSPPAYSIATPNQNSKWTFDPTSPGTSTLTLSRPFDTSCQVRPTLEIPVTVTREKASRVEINIINSQSDRIAGDTLSAEVKIFNSDGLVPGTYCFKENGDEDQQVVYNDTLKNPSVSYKNPRICVNGIWTDLNTGFSNDIKHDQCFNNGIDTIQFISYYAPFDAGPNDSVHIIRVTLDNDRQDEDEFILLPSDPDSLDITDYAFKSITDTVVFSSGDANKRTYKTVLYDKYGNIISKSPLCNWETDGNIKDTSAVDQNEMAFSPGVVLTTVKGILVAKYISGQDTISDHIDIKVTDLPAVLTSATTRDDNGNGFLDRIEIVFNKSVSIDRNNTSLFTVSYGTTAPFTIISIEPVGSDGTRYSVILEEKKTNYDNDTRLYEPQTNWKPTLSSAGQSDFEVVNKVCEDGAAPVVWYVYKEQKAGLDRSNDELSITLSEEVRTGSNQAFSESDIPELTFNVWYRDSASRTFQLIDTMLVRIPVYIEVSGDKLKLRMSNGHDITNKHYINIKTQENTMRDVKGNFPDSTNQKVNVKVHSDEQVAVVIPNPSRVSFEHTDPGVLVFKHDPLAREYAKNRKGIAVNIRIPFPEDKDGKKEKIKSVLKVYDIAGNLVISSYNNDLITGDDIAKDTTSGTYDMDIYWNGSNAKGMAVSPGIYKIVIYITYSNKSTGNLSYQLNAGFKK